MCYSITMSKIKYKMMKFIGCGVFAAGLVCFCAKTELPGVVHATTIEGLKGQIQTDKNKLQELYDQISALETQQDLLQEEIDDLNAEILHIMTEIGLKEQKIAATQEQITAKEVEITVKREQIAQTEARYNAAHENELEQRKSIRLSTRAMYEKGTTSYLGAILQGTGVRDILNQMDYVERVYNYEKDRLLEYLRIQEEATILWQQLEEEKAQLEEAQQALETDKRQLEEEKAKAEAQKKELDGMLAKKKKQSANFEAEMAKARKDAEAAVKRIQEEEAKLNSLQGGNNAANQTYKPTEYSSVIDNASGSELGKQVARFACQYIGNPYKYAGNSLTNGIDCSGFTQQVYLHFGYRISRSSSSQRNDGRAVSYDKMEPGDIICYEGHVAIYIGGGLIVHASNSKPYPQGGIKVGTAGYRPYITVRRIIP